MDVQLKSKWVAALRSGEFKQARGRLHDPGTKRYCCLGVLCRVAGLSINDAGRSPRGYSVFHEILGNEPTHALWAMNDSHGSSFSEIADYIEANVF